MITHARDALPLYAAWATDAGPVVAVLLLAVGYAAGVRRVWRAAGVGRGITREEVRWFVAAMAVLVAALISPLDALADEVFVAHMTQHVLLATVAPPLLLLAAPERALFWGLPFGIRRRAGRAIRRWGSVRTVWSIVTIPLAAFLLHTLAIWIWHAPRLYDWALRDAGAHLLEHLSFVGTGILLWWRIVHPAADRRDAAGTGIITLFATAMQTGVLGALLTFSHRVLYPAQAGGAARWGLTALDDQQLAGLVMWVVGGLLYVVAMSALFAIWLSPRGRRRARAAVVAAGVVGTAGCQRAKAVAVPDGNPGHGKELITSLGCGACHVIGGVPGAHGEVGPPLNGVARRAIIGGTLPNTPENMILWIENPPAIAPNTAMPNLGVTPRAARDIAAYLYTLR